MITVIKSPFVQYKLTILRNKKTSNTVFRQTMNEISYLIASDVLQYVPFKKQTIETPLKKMSGTACLLYTSPSPRDRQKSRMPSSA